MCEGHSQLAKIVREVKNNAKKDASTLKIHRGFIARW
jgi:hypothetical protein